MSKNWKKSRYVWFIFSILSAFADQLDIENIKKREELNIISLFWTETKGRVIFYYRDGEMRERKKFIKVNFFKFTKHDCSYQSN